MTRAEFVDWPVLIGIDNLDPTYVPEPSTYALMAAGLGMLGFMARRRRG